MKKVTIYFTDGTKEVFEGDRFDDVESSPEGVSIYDVRTNTHIKGRVIPWHRILQVSEEHTR